MSERWLPAWGLAAVAFGGASLIVPLYIVELGGDAFVLGILFASASFVGVPGALVFGNLADKTGKRRIFVLAAMAITAAAMVVIPLFNRIPPIIVANALLWLGFSAAIPILTLLVVAGEPEEKWSLLIAHLNEFQGIGWVFGIALGFVIIIGGTAVGDMIIVQRVFFVACAICAGLGFGLGVRTLPPDPVPGEEPSSRRLRRRMRNITRFTIRGAAFPFAPGRFDVRDLNPRRFLDRFTPQLATYFLAVSFVFTGFGVFFAPLPAYLSDIGYGSSGIFAFYLVVNAGATVFYGRAATLAETYGITQVHVGGLLMRGVAFPVIVVLGTVFGGTLLGLGAVTFVFLAIGMTWAVIAVTAATLVTKLAPAGIRGEALGVYGALIAVGGGVGGLLGGWLAMLGYMVTFGVAGGLVIMGASIVFLLSRRTAPTPGSDAESV